MTDAFVFVPSRVFVAGNPSEEESGKGERRVQCNNISRNFIMTPIELKSRADANGVLNLSIPIGTADANREVRVIAEPLDEFVSVEQ